MEWEGQTILSTSKIRMLARYGWGRNTCIVVIKVRGNNVLMPFFFSFFFFFLLLHRMESGSENEQRREWAKERNQKARKVEQKKETVSGVGRGKVMEGTTRRVECRGVATGAGRGGWGRGMDNKRCYFCNGAGTSNGCVRQGPS